MELLKEHLFRLFSGLRMTPCEGHAITCILRAAHNVSLLLCIRLAFTPIDAAEAPLSLLRPSTKNCYSTPCSTTQACVVETLDKEREIWEREEGQRRGMFAEEEVGLWRDHSAGHQESFRCGEHVRTSTSSPGAFVSYAKRYRFMPSKCWFAHPRWT